MTRRDLSLSFRTKVTFFRPNMEILQFNQLVNLPHRYIKIVNHKSFQESYVSCPHLLVIYCSEYRELGVEE